MTGLKLVIAGLYAAGVLLSPLSIPKKEYVMLQKDPDFDHELLTYEIPGQFAKEQPSEETKIDTNYILEVEQIETYELDPEPEPEYTEAGGSWYYGRCWITHYCPCSRCCGKSDGITASGTYATEGWTVACGGLPFGTLIELNGHTYCVEDRGVEYYAIDIFVEDHQRALELGAYWADVYVLEG